MDRDDEVILNYLSAYRIPYDSSNNIMRLIKQCRRDSRYRYLNLEYLSVSAYVLSISKYAIDIDMIKSHIHMIPNNNKDLVYRVIYRYCLYILTINRLNYI